MTQVYRRPESVLVLIYDTQHQVLLLERSDVAGYWQSVTGSLEPGETPAQAARRELFEETGLSESRSHPLQDLRRQVRFTIPPRWQHRFAPHITTNLEHQFALQVPAGTPVRLSPDEHLRAAWLSAGQALKQVSSWSNREAIELVLCRAAKSGADKKHN